MKNANCKIQNEDVSNSIEYSPNNILLGIFNLEFCDGTEFADYLVTKGFISK
jgi:hypothetical protein